MFEKIKNIVASFVEQYNRLKATFDSEVARIKATYIEGNSQFVNEMRIAKDTFEHGVQAIRESSLAQVNTVIQEMNSALEKMVVADVEHPNYSTELELLRNADLTQYEVDAYLKKYSHSYLASKIMKEIAESKGLETDRVMTVNDFKKMIQETFDDCQTLFNKYQGNDPMKQIYSCQCIIHGDKFDRFEKQSKTFLQLVEGEK